MTLRMDNRLFTMLESEVESNRRGEEKDHPRIDSDCKMLVQQEQCKFFYVSQ